MDDEERDLRLDRSPEIFGFAADLLIILATMVVFGIVRC